MTSKEKEEIERKYRELINWSIEEEERVFCELKKQGKIVGLDGFYPELRAVTLEYHKKLNELRIEYGLAPIDFSKYDDAVR